MILGGTGIPTEAGWPTLPASFARGPAGSGAEGGGFGNLASFIASNFGVG
jgi:hypothetical protein